MNVRPRLVLASASPRRHEILAALGLAFEVRPVDADETPKPGEAPRDLVLRLARTKADAAARPGEIALGADTIVVLDGEILGKPGSAAEARSMLGRLAGREHAVWTGVSVVETSADGGRKEASRAVASSVRIAPLAPERIAWYVATGEPLDKAGAYAIQGLGTLFVESVEGNYANVVGLPVPAVAAALADLGHDLLAFRHDAATSVVQRSGRDQTVMRSPRDGSSNVPTNR